MGQKSSVVKVTANVTVPSDCDTVDAVRLSYKRRWCCCGSRKRVVADFTFPRKDWIQLSPHNMLRNNSAEVVPVHVGKLRKKDGSIPVKVDCLSEGASVFRTEMTLAECITSLKLTEVGGKALLSFSLAGQRVTGTATKGQSFTALFCNGKRCGARDAEHLLERSQQHHTHTTSESDEEIPIEGEYSPEVEQNAKEWEEFLLNDYDDVWNDESSAEIEPPHQEVKEREASKENKSPSPTHDDKEQEVMDEKDPSMDVDSVQQETMERKTIRRKKGGKSFDSLRSTARRTRAGKIPRGEDAARGSLWDLVADCAGVVSLVLIMYHAWIEYDKYW